jgi:SAM-dependent methyltransferase
MDALLEVDWAAHWRYLVEARAAQAAAPSDDHWWEGRARQFRFSMAGQPDPFLEFIEPWLHPSRTLIDVGAGIGRHVAPLSGRLDWVTAVEPAQAMRDQIPALDNVTVIGTTWEDAEPAAADLVICVSVLYPIAEPVPFLQKLERYGRERIFVVLRDSVQPHPAELMAGPARVREPRLRDCYLLLREMGIMPDVTMFERPVFFRFESLEAAIDDCRLRLGSIWDDQAGPSWLASNLRPAENGTMIYEGGQMASGVLHWTPRN